MERYYIARKRVTTLVEFSLHGYIDATDSPTIPVVERAMEWLGDIKNGRDVIGNKLKTADGIKRALVSEAEYLSSDIFIAQQIICHERPESFCNKCLFKTMKEKDDIIPEGYTSSVKRLVQTEMPQPVVYPVLKATARLREKKKEELQSNGFDFENISLLDHIPRDSTCRGDDESIDVGDSSSSSAESSDHFGDDEQSIFGSIDDLDY